MAVYDYLCRNDVCPSVMEERPRHVERMCSIKDGAILPKCGECGQDMPKAYMDMPAVRHRYIDANGLMKKSFMGPSQRADRRCAGWVDGIQQFKPVYNEGRTDVRRRELKVTPQAGDDGDESRTTGGAEG